MSRSTAECVLRLDDAAWTLRSAAGETRVLHDGEPAEALMRLESDSLKSDSLNRGTKMQVVLGDGWLRYLVLRWPETVRSAEERDAFMAHRFREVHGIAAPEWALRADRAAVEFPALGCAAPATLIVAVTAFVKARKWRLESMTGDFVSQFNRLRRRFNEAGGTLGGLAVARQARLTVGVWRDGAWLAVRSRAYGTDAEGDLASMLSGWRVEYAPAEQAVLYAAGIEPNVPEGWNLARREPT